jgi:hypothetical protein
MFLFQSTSLAFDIVNEENIYTCTGKPQRNDIANIVNWMLNEDYKTAYQSILSEVNFDRDFPKLFHNNLVYNSLMSFSFNASDFV